MTVLIVDDDSANRMLLASLVRHAGHEAHAVATGEDALRVAQQHPPDLVIVDLHMPGMGGVAFIKELRHGAETAEVEIALYTATEMSAPMRDFMEMFAIRGFIPKPSEPNDILRAIDEALRERTRD